MLVLSDFWLSGPVSLGQDLQKLCRVEDFFYRFFQFLPDFGQENLPTFLATLVATFENVEKLKN